jgi:hypothetical protein
MKGHKLCYDILKKSPTLLALTFIFMITLTTISIQTYSGIIKLNTAMIGRLPLNMTNLKKD